MTTLPDIQAPARAAEPLVTVIPHRRVVGYSGAGGAKARPQLFEVLPLSEALTREWETDAHAQPIAVYKGAERRTALPRLRVPAFAGMEAAGYRFMTEIVLIDVDLPDHKPWDSLALQKERLTSLRQRFGSKPHHPLWAAGIYGTRRGYRLVWVLSDPVDARLWRDFLGAPSACPHRGRKPGGLLAWLEKETAGTVEGDWRCSAPTHLYGLPRTRRDGEQHAYTPHIDLAPLKAGRTLDPAPFLFGAKKQEWRGAGGGGRAYATEPPKRLPPVSWEALEELRPDYNRLQLEGLGDCFELLRDGQLLRALGDAGPSAGYSLVRSVAYHVAQVERCTDPVEVLARILPSVEQAPRNLSSEGIDRAREHAWRHAHDAAAACAEWMTGGEIVSQLREAPERHPAARGKLLRRLRRASRPKRAAGWAAKPLSCPGAWWLAELAPGVSEAEAAFFLGRTWSRSVAIPLAEHALLLLVGEHTSRVVELEQTQPIPAPAWLEQLPYHAAAALEGWIERPDTVEQAEDLVRAQLDAAHQLVTDAKWDQTELGAHRIISEARKHVTEAHRLAARAGDPELYTETIDKADELVARCRDEFGDAVDKRSIGRRLGCSSRARMQHERQLKAAVRERKAREEEKERSEAAARRMEAAGRANRRVDCPVPDLWWEFPDPDRRGDHHPARSTVQAYRMVERRWRQRDEIRQPDPAVLAALSRKDDGTASSTLPNLEAILDGDPVFEGLHLNYFDQQHYLDGAPLADQHITAIRVWVERVYGVSKGHDDVRRVLDRVAGKQGYDPVESWLRQLPPGMARQPNLWTFGTTGFRSSVSFSNTIFAKWLMQGAARILWPGEKCDVALVLRGKQGRRKSSALEALAGERGFRDSVLRIGHKEGYAMLHGVVVFELSELASMKGQQIEPIKQFLSARWDAWQPKFRNEIVQVPRRCIFAGTTNEGTFLRDHTGNRRFAPIFVERQIDIAHVRRMRDVLWAEARDAVLAWDADGRPGERPPWVFTPEEEAQIDKLNDDVTIRDAWEEPIRDYLERMAEAYPDRRINVSRQALMGICGIPMDRRNMTAERRITGVMEALGWEYAQRRYMKARATRRWLAPEEDGRPMTGLTPDLPIEEMS